MLENPKALGSFRICESLTLAEGNGLSLLLWRESAALSCHGDHSRLGRRLTDLFIESGQPQSNSLRFTNIHSADDSSVPACFAAQDEDVIVHAGEDRSDGRQSRRQFYGSQPQTSGKPKND